MAKQKKQKTISVARKTTLSAKSGPPIWLWLAGSVLLLVLLVGGLFYLGNM